MILTITMVVLPSGSTYPAVEVASGIFLTHPNLSVETLLRPYEKAVIDALQKETTQLDVISAADSGVQFMLPLGENWKAPLSVHSGKEGQVIALLHYGPA